MRLQTLEVLKWKTLLMSWKIFSLIDSGHILGAKGLLFDDVFYTGDICTRDRAFLKASIIPKM